MGNIPDELIEKYADEMLKKRENVEPLVELPSTASWPSP